MGAAEFATAGRVPYLLLKQTLSKGSGTEGVKTYVEADLLSEKEAQRTIEAARKLGVWPQPLKLHRSLSKSGRGLVLRIPADLEKDLKLKPGKPVSISKVGSKIIIEPEQERE